jgi:hypothetical protein
MMIVDSDSIAQSAGRGGEPFSVIAEISDVDVASSGRSSTVNDAW